MTATRKPRAERPAATKLPAGPLPCTLAPAGWLCTREADHEGPCAALPVRPIDPPAELVSAAQRPGPGARVTRTAGQGGIVLTIVQLWQAFGWAGAGDWTGDEAAQRWPAITAALVLAVAIGQNVAGWLRER
jgi:hypothetical protein